ncbi:hypothetical protein [Actinacidiphila sp. ITFR-21]|uniref:hypothetical protein n=1 Tax=Actinacidiphila sp. ITFR-21 TaxID=3075199 RepID=UPI00288A6248|nr:hypothetical protein [Streptomyces sp. ITFR-21]WNI20327.1 hypothetical protein RLT57_33200 [Streptomyces sp. ITFR-21]
MTPGQLTYLTRCALEAAQAGDRRRTAEMTGRLAREADALDLVSACRVMADIGLRALLVLYGQPNAARGEAWVLDQLGDAEGHPCRLFAARLVTAYANADNDTVTALAAVAAGATPAERAESLRSLATYAAGLDARAARQKNDHDGRNDR